MMWLLALWEKLGRGVTSLLRPYSLDPDRRSRENALNALFLGTLALTCGALVVVTYNFIFLHFDYLLPRVGVIGVLFAVMLALYVSFKRGYYIIPTYSLLIFYFVSAAGVLYEWGANNPIGLLLLALVTILAGILLGARYSLYALLLAVGVLTLLSFLALKGISHPDMAWASRQASLYDVVVVGLILTNLSIISWLFNRSMEQSLRRAQNSEEGLRRQKELLEVKVEERTRQVQAAQLERVQELYRFAELGHMSVALLHELANYLAVLSLDIEDLKQTRKDRSSVMHRVQDSIRHLNSLIMQVRHQIKGETTVVPFNISHELGQVIKLLEYKANAQHVVLLHQKPPRQSAFQYEGSVSHFWQIMTNVISNAIDAYDATRPKEQRQVVITATARPHLTITVTDFGVGIAKDKLKKIFEPFYSTKENGSGIGLAIAKRMVEKDFDGTIQVKSELGKGTAFMVTLPRHEPKRSRSRH